jgi:hypothetical protein
MQTMKRSMRVAMNQTWAFKNNKNNKKLLHSHLHTLHGEKKNKKPSHKTLFLIIKSDNNEHKQTGSQQNFLEKITSPSTH